MTAWRTCLSATKQEKRLKMKRNIIASLLLAVASLAMAQPKAGTFSIIPRVGVSIATLTKDNIYTVSGDEGVELSNRWKTGMMAGFDLDYQVLPQVSVSLGAYYSEMGCKYDETQITDRAANVPGKYLGFNNAETNLRYINVPLMLNMYVSHNFAVKVGVQAGFNVYGKSEITETKFTVNDDETTDYEKPETTKFDYNAKTFDLAIPIGLSYEYMNVIVDARYNLGLTRISPILGSSSPKNNAITINAAYRFTL